MDISILPFLKRLVSGILAFSRLSFLYKNFSRTLKPALVFYLLFVVGHGLFAQSMMTEGFERHVPKNNSSSRPFRLGGSNDATVSTSYARSGSKSLRSFIPISPTVSDPRSEIQHKGWTGSPTFVQSEHKFFTTRSFGFSFYFPNNFQDFDPVIETLMQWKNSNEGAPCVVGSPGFSIRLGEDKLSYNIKYGKSACSGNPKTKGGTINKSIKKGVWHNFVVEIHNDYREKGGNGYVKVWYSEGGTINKSSDLVVNYKGAVGYEGKEGPFLKLGLYKSQWQNADKRDESKNAGVSKREMYIDDVFIIEGTFGGSPSSPNPPKNDPPTADAGKDITITLPDNLVTIDGKGTSSVGIDTYSWEKVSGPNSTVRKKDQAQLIAEDLEEGRYVYRLTVTDKNGNKATDDVKVTVKAAEVQADAGKDITITLPVNSVTIDGKGTSGASYSWEKVSGPNSTVRKKEQAQLIAEDLEEGRYVYRLTVTDKNGNKATDDVKVTVKAAEVQADAGKDITITLPVNSVTIDGKGTSGASYSWEKVSGPNSTVRKKEQAQLIAEDLEEGKYVYRLTVTDKNGNKATDDVKVTVIGTSNEAPTAQAGKDLTVTLPNDEVMISGSANDADGQVTGYQWKQLSGPSDISLNGQNTRILKVSSLVPGTFKFQLKVTDNQGATHSDQVTVNVLPPKPNITADITDATCKGSNGVIALKIDGGSKPFTIEWSNGSSNQKLNNVTTGEYTAKVTDKLGRTVSKKFTVGSKKAELKVSAEIKNATCDNNNGSLKVEVNGGTAPYNYEWSAAGRSASLNELSAGSYSLLVSDKNGCSKKVSFEVGTDAVKINLDITSEITNASCTGNDGSISLSVGNTDNQYSYVWDHGETGANIENLEDGKYKVTITDNHGCFAESVYTINQNPGPEKPIILQAGDSLYVFQQAINYQWYKDSVAIRGGNNNVIKIAESGIYSVEVSNDQTCMVSSDYFNARDPIFPTNSTYTFQQVEFYPNPASSNINVRITLNRMATTSVTIYDFSGRELLTRELGMVNSQITESLPLDSYPSGTYLIRARASDEIVTRRFIKH